MRTFRASSNATISQSLRVYKVHSFAQRSPVVRVKYVRQQNFDQEFRPSKTRPTWWWWWGLLSGFFFPDSTAVNHRRRISARTAILDAPIVSRNGKSPEIPARGISKSVSKRVDAYLTKNYKKKQKKQKKQKTRFVHTTDRRHDQDAPSPGVPSSGVGPDQNRSMKFNPWALCVCPRIRSGSDGAFWFWFDATPVTVWLFSCRMMFLLHFARAFWNQTCG